MSDQTTTKQPIHISFTQVKMRSQCPWAWYAKYRLGQQELKTAASQAGTLIHRSLETYAKSCVENKLPTDLQFAESIAKTMGESEAQTFMAFARSLILDDNSRFEWEFEVPLMDGVTFTGKVDYLTFDGPNRVIVTDYKSFPNYAMREEYAPLQLELYAWAVTKHWPEIRSFRVVQRHPDGSGGIRDYWWDIDYLSLVTIPDMLKGYAREIVSEDEGGGRYEPCAGSWCQWCRLECPGRNGQIQPIQTEEDYLGVLHKLQQYGALVDTLKDLAKQGYDNFGKGSIGDRDWVGRPRKKTVWDIPRLQADAAQNGLDLNSLDLLSVNGVKAKTVKTRKTLEGLGLNIEGYKTEVEGSMEYKFVKAGDEDGGENNGLDS